MNKLNILKELIENKKTCGCTITGTATDELYSALAQGKNIMKLFKNKGIDIPYKLDIEGLEHTYINVYIPKLQEKEVAITVSDKVDITVELVNNIINNFLINVGDVYQYDIMSYHIDMIIGTRHNEIQFKDILLYLNRNFEQKEIAEKMEISQQLITEVKNNRKKFSIENISKLISLFPLMFWYEYLINIKEV